VEVLELVLLLALPWVALVLVEYLEHWCGLHLEMDLVLP
jgi:hypothetical protein